MVGIKTRNLASKQLRLYLRQNDMRPTKVRRMVLEQIFQLPQPFTAEQLVHACEAERIAVATVYNTLNLCVLAQILHAIDRQRGKAAVEYELIVGKSARMQVICSKCGRVTDLRDQVIERLIKEKKYTNFDLRYFSLFVYGECKICRRRTNKNNK